MKMTNSFTINELLRSHLQVKETLAVVIASALIPFFIHLIPPFTNAPVGAVLLPMFYAPLVAVLLFRYHVGLIAAILAPVLNALITGAPAWPLTATLTIELMAFVSLVHLFQPRIEIKWLVAPLAFVATKAISASIILLLPGLMEISAITYFGASFSNGLIGIVILTMIGYFTLKLKK